MAHEASLSQTYFDTLYARDSDPWRFRSSAYEQAKYADTIAALEGRRFAKAAEIGCSIGELTSHLAPCCDRLLGLDISEAPLRLARERNAGAPQVQFQRMTLPDERPSGAFDLIVLSEVLYYFSPDDLRRVADWTCEALAQDGVALLVHWLGETPDYPLDGDTAVTMFKAAAPALTTDLQQRRGRYRLDRLARPV